MVFLICNAFCRYATVLGISDAIKRHRMPNELQPMPMPLYVFITSILLFPTQNMIFRQI